MVSRLYTTKSIADLLETSCEVFWASRAIFIVSIEEGSYLDNTVSNKIQISSCVTWTFCESQGSFELEFRTHSILFSWSNIVFSQGTTTWYYKSIFKWCLHCIGPHQQDQLRNLLPRREGQRTLERRLFLGHGVLGQRLNISKSWWALTRCICECWESW